MKTIRNWQGLEEYGIDLLTGESCAYGYRGLCDVTEQGAKIIKDCLGLIEDRPLPMAGNWNSKGIGSIMLPYEMFTPLAVFALIQANCLEIAITTEGGGRQIRGLEAEDDPEQYARFIEYNQKYNTIERIIKNPGFSRHRHAFSGRTT